MKLFDLVARIPSTGTPSALAGKPSRRDVLSPAAFLAGMWSLGARAQPPDRTADPNLWLVHHLTMGLTEAELARVSSLGYTGYLEYQLNYEAIDDSALDERLAAYLTLTLEPFDLMHVPRSQVISELTEATILRSVLSERQLYQRMVEFWTDHFNIDISKDDCAWLKVVDDREVIRAHALGNFRDLLSASVHSPAMLFYLDNQASIVGNPNENYARELMELHTLGVDGGYTQQDVVEVARCFTGWRIHPLTSGTDYWRFQFDPGWHDDGPKMVLGNSIPAGGGINDGEMVLDILANHPSTARFIARKMASRFWGYDPPQSLVDSVAAAYTQTSGDIRATVRAIFNSPEAAQMPVKYKRPYHLFVSALRASAATINTTTSLRQVHFAASGHTPFVWGPPDGYPDVLDYWVGLFLPRWNFGSALVAGDIQGISVDINALMGGEDTAQGIVDRIDTVLFGGTMPAADKDRIRSYLLPDPPDTGRMHNAVGLAIDSPPYQWY